MCVASGAYQVEPTNALCPNSRIVTHVANGALSAATGAPPDPITDAATVRAVPVRPLRGARSGRSDSARTARAPSSTRHRTPSASTHVLAPPDPVWPGPRTERGAVDRRIMAARGPTDL